MGEKRCWQVGSYGAGSTTYNTEPDKWGGFVPKDYTPGPVPTLPPAIVHTPRPTSVPSPTPSPVTPGPQPQAAPVPPLPSPTPARVPVPPPLPVLVPAPAPSGDCVPSGPAYYAAACKALVTTCEQHSFCKRVPAGSSTPATISPTGDCVSNDPNIDYSAACKTLEATCEQFSFCKRVSSLAQSSAVRSVPVRLRRLRRSTDHVLIQQGDPMQGAFADDEKMDGIVSTDESQPGSAVLHVTRASHSEL